MGVYRLSDQEKLSKVIGRLIDNEVQNDRLEADDARQILGKLQDAIDALDDADAARVLNGSGDERQV